MKVALPDMEACALLRYCSFHLKWQTLSCFDVDYQAYQEQAQVVTSCPESLSVSNQRASFVRAPIPKRGRTIAE